MKHFLVCFAMAFKVGDAADNKRYTELLKSLSLGEYTDELTKTVTKAQHLWDGFLKLLELVEKDVDLEQKAPEKLQAYVSAIKSFVEMGVCLPIAAVISRPFIEHEMLSAVVMVAGRDTGATLFGPADMQVSANTSVKTIEGHYTCHTKAMVSKPQNVNVLRDIMCAGYVGGSNSLFFGGFGRDKMENAEGIKIPAGAADVKESVTLRLQGEEYLEDRGFESLFAFPVSHSDFEKHSQHYSMSTQVLPWDTDHSMSAGEAGKDFPGGNDSFVAYSEKFGLSTVHYGQDTHAMRTQSFINHGSMNNALCILVSSYSNR